MTNITYHLGAKSGPRQEDARACAEHLAVMLATLARIHPAFARWYKQGYSRSAADHPFCTMPPDVEELTKILRRHPFTRGFPEDGFTVSAWNGKERSHGTSFSLNAGSAARYAIWPNLFSMPLRYSGAEDADLINAAVLRQAMLAVAAAWNPDWVDLSPWGYFERWQRAAPWDDGQREEKRKDDERKIQRSNGYIPAIRGGWMTYLCPEYARRIARPAGIEVEPVAGGGVLFIATRENFTPGNPEHDAAADAIQEVLLPLQNLPYQAMRR